jgi:hypothetical protein
VIDAALLRVEWRKLAIARKAGLAIHSHNYCFIFYLFVK